MGGDVRLVEPAGAVLSVEPGRWIYRNGAPFVSIHCAKTPPETGGAAIDPTGADTFTRAIVAAHDDLRDAYTVLTTVAAYSADSDLRLRAGIMRARISETLARLEGRR